MQLNLEQINMYLSITPDCWLAWVKRTIKLEKHNEVMSSCHLWTICDCWSRTSRFEKISLMKNPRSISFLIFPHHQPRTQHFFITIKNYCEQSPLCLIARCNGMHLTFMFFSFSYPSIQAYTKPTLLENCLRIVLYPVHKLKILPIMVRCNVCARDSVPTPCITRCDFQSQKRHHYQI